MDPRPWFVTLVRFSGLLIMVISLPSVGGVLDALLRHVTYWNWNPLRALTGAALLRYDGNRVLFGPLCSLAQFGIGLWMFVRGRRLVARLAPPDGSVCTHCGYDLRGTGSPRCPECGRLVPPRRTRSTSG